MGQREIIEYLRMRRQTGDNEYHSIRSMAVALKCPYRNIHRCIYPLVRMGILESKATGDLFEWFRVFRLAEKYVEEGVDNGRLQ